MFTRIISAGSSEQEEKMREEERIKEQEQKNHKQNKTSEILRLQPWSVELVQLL